MILEIDMGNTRLKWRAQPLSTVPGVLKPDDGLTTSGSCLTVDFENCTELKQLQGIKKVKLACVAGKEKEAQLQSFVQQQWQLPVLVAHTCGELAGVVNSYADPSRMGTDRWLAMVAAYNQCSTGNTNKACLIVDSGTTTTIDWVDGSGQHQGGFILPGLSMMSSSLLKQTEQVRFDGLNKQGSPSWGKSTAEAVEHGALFMTLAAIEKAYEQSFQKDRETAVLLCGGSADTLAKHLSVPFQLAAELVLDGLRYTA